MKVIFLDLDGVLCLQSEWGKRYKHRNEEGMAGVFDPLNKRAVEILNDILISTGAEIVISSDWRFHAPLARLSEWLVLNGLIKNPIDTTPIDNLWEPDKFPFDSKWDCEQTRTIDILKWLEDHPNVEKWVAVDDLNLGVSPWGLTNFVHTPRGNEGIKQSGVKEKILKFLV